jgi:hypothetical protein
MCEGNTNCFILFKIVHQISVGKSHSKSSFRERWLEGTLRKWCEDINLIQVVKNMLQWQGFLFQ